MTKAPKRTWELLLKVALVAGAVGFLGYGVSIFLAKPTIETITTRSQHTNTRTVPAHDINYQNHR